MRAKGARTREGRRDQEKERERRTAPPCLHNENFCYFEPLYRHMENTASCERECVRACVRLCNAFDTIASSQSMRVNDSQCARARASSSLISISSRGRTAIPGFDANFNIFVVSIVIKRALEKLAWTFDEKSMRGVGVGRRAEIRRALVVAPALSQPRCSPPHLVRCAIHLEGI